MESTKSYAPFNEDEFIFIKSEMERFGNNLPTDKMGWLWSKCTLLRGNTKEPQPCGCKSAAGLWQRCAEDVRAYIKRVEE
jgi:hypothetical protein